MRRGDFVRGSRASVTGVSTTALTVAIFGFAIEPDVALLRRAIIVVAAGLAARGGLTIIVRIVSAIALASSLATI